MPAREAASEATSKECGELGEPEKQVNGHGRSDVERADGGGSGARSPGDRDRDEASYRPSVRGLAHGGAGSSGPSVVPGAFRWREQFRQRLDPERARDGLIQLASEFDRNVDLLASTQLHIAVEHARILMADGGSYLLRLLAAGVAPMPTSQPTWLSWWFAPAPRLRFNATRAGPGATGSWNWSRGVVGLGFNLGYRPAPPNSGRLIDGPRPRSDFLRRQIFIEAAGGWLGALAKAHARITLPSIEVGLSGPGDLGETIQWVTATTDRLEDADEERLMFVELGRACATVCRYLATSLEEIGEEPVGLRGAIALADHVERAFDLMATWRKLVTDHPLGSVEDRLAEQRKVEDAMRFWLPKARPARCRLVDVVLAALGDDAAVLGALGQGRLRKELRSELERLAEQAIPSGIDARTVAGHYGVALEHWRSIQPDVPETPRQQQQYEHVRLDAQIHRIYWTHRLASRCSYLGASLILARACEVTAEIGGRSGRPAADVRPALRFSQLLRGHPDWTDIVSHKEIAGLLREQHRLGEVVELLVAELVMRRSPAIETEALPALPKSAGRVGRVNGTSRGSTGSARMAKPENDPGRRAGPGRGKRRPSPGAIDRAAQGSLTAAIEASAEHGVYHIPTREQLALAVSRELDMHLTVASLFATKAKGGERVPRYPGFLALWRKVQRESKAARPTKGRSGRVQKKPGEQDA